MSANQDASLVILFFAALAGLTMIMIGFQTRTNYRRLARKQSSSAVGTIVDKVQKHEHSPYGGMRDYWVPVIRFVANGREYTGESRLGRKDEAEIVIGKTVEILFDPENPEAFHTAEDTGDDIAGRHFIIAGAVILAAGLIFALVTGI